MCLLLVASAVLTVSGCASTSSNSSTTTSGSGSNLVDTSGSANATTDLPKSLTFQDEDDDQRIITFVYCEGNGDYTARSISIDDTPSNSVDSAIYNRNAKITEWLGVEIDSYKATDSISGLESAISASLEAGDSEYDVICGYQYYSISMATKGYLQNFNTLVDSDGNSVNYIDLEKDYWATDYINALSYNDCTYWITGDLSLRLIGGMYCTYVNATLYENFLYNTYGSIYQIVKDGKWTLDLLATMASAVYLDNGNEPDVVDDADTIGFAYELNDPIDGLAFASQVPFSTRYDDGTIGITISSTRTVSFVTALDNLLHNTNALQCTDNDSTYVMPQFASGNVCFTVNKLFQAESYLTSMEDSYYIIPAPKLNEAQENYVTGIHDGCTIYGISYASDCVPAAAATLELMAYYGSTDVIPQYYNSALKFTYTTDSESGEMIDLIHSNVNTDFAAAWSQSIGDMVHFFRTNNTSNKISAKLTKAKSTYDTKLAQLLEDLMVYAEG
jgi:hypothetical protein